MNNFNPKSPYLTATVVKISPDLAEQWLRDYSVVNRNISNVSVEAIVSDIKSNNWKANGESICFDTTGHIRDGYHRLTAIKKCKGFTDGVTAVVVTGVSVEDGNLYDVGHNRKMSNYMTLTHPDNKFLADTRIVAAARMDFVMNGNFKPSTANVEKNLIEHKETYYKLYSHMNKNIAKSNCKCSTAPLLYAFAKAIEAGEDEEKVFQFMNVFNSGIMKDASDSLIVNFRNDYINDFAGRRGSTGSKDVVKLCETYLYNYIHPTNSKRIKFSDKTANYYYSK